MKAKLTSVNHLELRHFESAIKQGAPKGGEREEKFKHQNPEL